MNLAQRASAPGRQASSSGSVGPVSQSPDALAGPPLRLIIADDHALFRGGLILLLRLMDTPIEVVEANDLGQVVEALSGGPPADLLLLDLLMPGMDGIAGVERICRDWPDVPVVVVSVREDTNAIREALQAGAMGYIPKTSSPDVTTNALRLVLSGGVYIPPQVLRGGSDVAPGPLAEAGSAGGRGGADDLGLTDRQIEVLRLMARGRSNKDIATELCISTGTVKMHVSRIFKALSVTNRTEAAAQLTRLWNGDR